MYNLSDQDKKILLNFQDAKIPTIFKEEYIEHMLFIELIDFDICSSLLNNRKIDIKLYQEAISGYEYFLSDINVSKLEKDSFDYYNQCIKIINILKEKTLEISLEKA